MKDTNKILIAEDDANLGMVLCSYLNLKGYSSTLCENGEIALEQFKKDDYALCLIDIMMPVKDGYSLVADIRKINQDVPIFFMTAKSMQEDVLKGFAMEVDDYIIKPFSMDELLMRMRSVMRRVYSKQENDKTTYQVGKYLFNKDIQQLIYDKKVIKLTSKETALLIVLCEKMNKVVDRNYILSKVWDKDDYYNARSMDVYITKLRRILKDDPKISILNIHGVGFKLVVES